MLKVAVTGGIGSGKSTFSTEAKKKKIKLIDSDEQVLQIYKKPKREFLKFLNKIGLGDAIKKNNIDKKFISNKIFSNKKIRLKLETYIFSEIRKKRKQLIKKETKRRTKIIIFDIPLLFENNLQNNFNIVISIIAKRKTRYKRLKNSKNMSKELFGKIIRSQTTDVDRKSKSDIVILNNKSLNEYKARINKVLNKINHERNSNRYRNNRP